MISRTRPFLEEAVRNFVELQHEHVTESWDLQWHIYGDKSGDDHDPTQLFIIGEALAPTQELATSIAATARVATIHGPYEGQKATSGNFGHGIGGATTQALGPCAEFCVYHLMALRPGEERGSEEGPLFRIQSMTLSQRQGRQTTPTDEEEEKAKHFQEQTQRAVKSAINGEWNKPEISSKSDPPTKLVDIAQVIRSKNSGPYEITLDVMFATQEIYQAIKDASLLTVDAIASLYGLRPEQVIFSGFFDQAMAFKATIPRMRNGKPVAAGGFMEDDVHGSQVHPPLMALKLPDDLAKKLVAMT
jgi:hypothetical protein